MDYSYVMLEVSREDGLVQKIPIVFPQLLVHKDVAEAIVKVLEKDGIKAKVSSAGALRMDEVTVYPDSKSSTLGVDCNPRDEDTIVLYPYFHGIQDA